MSCSLFRMPARRRAGVMVTGMVIAGVGAGNVLPVEVASASTRITFLAAADTYTVSSASSTNYSASTVLKASGNPARTTFLRFNVTNLSRAPGSAQLRLYAKTSGTTFAIHRVHADPRTWSPNTTVWKNQPTVGAAMATHGRFSTGTWTTVDVTSAVTGSGTYDFAVTSATGAEPKFASRESGPAEAPQLLVAPGAGVTPTPTPTATATQSPPATGTPVPTSAPTPGPGVTPAPTASPPPTPRSTPGPTATPAPTWHHVPVLAFTGPASPADPVSGKLVYDVLWSQIEPVEGQYDFSAIDREMAPWIAAHKFVAIRIQHVMGNGAQGTPQWLLNRVGVVDPSLHVPNYFNAAYEPSRVKLATAFHNWLAASPARSSVKWVEWGIGIYGETKVDSEQNHSINLASWTAAGYTDAKWDALVTSEAKMAHDILAPLGIPVVENMNRSFIGGTPGYTAARLGAELRAEGVWLGNHGYRQGVAPGAQYLSGPTIWEQYLSSGSTGFNADTEVREMIGLADAHGGYVLIYGSDISKAAPALSWART